MTSPADVDLWADIPPPTAPSTEPAAGPTGPVAYLWSWWETRAGGHGWTHRGLLTTTVRQHTLDTLTLGGRAAGALIREEAVRTPPDTLREVVDRISRRFTSPPPPDLTRSEVLHLSYTTDAAGPHATLQQLAFRAANQLPVDPETRQFALHGYLAFLEQAWPRYQAARAADHPAAITLGAFLRHLAPPDPPEEAP
jgi:hypothetical protein